MAPVMAVDSDCTKCKAMTKRGDKIVACAGCHSTLHITCIEGIDKAMVSNFVQIADCPFIAIFCSTACKSQFPQGKGDSHVLKRLEEKVDSMADFLGANLVPSSDSNSDSDGFTTVTRKRSSYASAASKGTVNAGLVKVLQDAVIAAPKIQQAEDKRLRTVVIEGLPDSEQQDPVKDDTEAAKLMLADIDCGHIEVEGTERMRNYSKDRPAIMKIFLKSKRDRDTVLRSKRKLRDSDDFGNCFIRPSLTEVARIRRDYLRQISLQRALADGFATVKLSPYRTVLNDFTEQYELRLVQDGKLDWKSPAIVPSRAETESAQKALEAKRSAGRRHQSGN